MDCPTNDTAQQETRISSARVFMMWCYSYEIFPQIFPQIVPLTQWPHHLSLFPSGYSAAPVEELTNGLLFQHLQFWVQL